MIRHELTKRKNRHDPEQHEDFDAWMDSNGSDDILRAGPILFVMCLTVLSVFIVVATYLIIDIWAATGPGCPGDPEWLGFCSEVDGR